MKYIKNITYFFPIQLLIVALKQHFFKVFCWILLICFVTEQFGNNYGFPYLFLDPEYIGQVGFLSFAIIGLALGGLTMSWNLSLYLRHSTHFPFMASLKWPFAMFCLNNSLLPLLFFVLYIYKIVDFQLFEEFDSWQGVCLKIMGLLLGLMISTIAYALYFQRTNKNIFGFIRPALKYKKSLKNIIYKKPFFKRKSPSFTTNNDSFRVDTFLSIRLHVRLTRNVQHYNRKLRQLVFKQHHQNAFAIQFFSIAGLVSLGYVIEYPLFQLPAASSIIILLSVFMGFAGFLQYWFSSWTYIVGVLLFISLNIFTKYGFLTTENKAYGLDYNSNVEYTLEKLNTMASEKNMQEDIQNTLQILNNWKAKNKYIKPKLCIISASGGGLGAGIFTLEILQKAEKETDGALGRQTFLMTGASGGMYGLSYAREIWYNNRENQAPFFNPIFSKKLAQDLANPLGISIITSDILFPWRTFKQGDYRYRKDRGYMLEKKLNQNTDGVLDKRIKDYKYLEYEAKIPLLIYATTGISDFRHFYVSSQPIRYLMRPQVSKYKKNQFEIDAVDFGQLFKKNKGYDLSILSAMRMSSTYPIVLPAVTLPSSPPIEVIDAGIRDNYGLEVVIKFLHVFEKWILKNTSGVVLIEIRNQAKFDKIEKEKRKTILHKLLNPVGSIYANIDNAQDFKHDYLLSGLSVQLRNKLRIVRFENKISSRQDHKLSLSLHLTEREKKCISTAVENKENRASFEALKKWLDN